MYIQNSYFTITKKALPRLLKHFILPQKFNLFAPSPNITTNLPDITSTITKLESEINVVQNSDPLATAIENINPMANTITGFPVFNSLKKIMHWHHFKKILEAPDKNNMVTTCSKRATIWDDNFNYTTSSIITENNTVGNNKNELIKAIDNKIYSLSADITKHGLNYGAFTQSDLKQILETLFVSNSAKIIALKTMLDLYYAGGSVSNFLDTIENKEDYSFTYKNKSTQINKIDVINEIKKLSIEEHELLFKFSLHQQRPVRLFTIAQFNYEARGLILHKEKIKLLPYGATADDTATSSPSSTPQITHNPFGIIPPCSPDRIEAIETFRSIISQFNTNHQGKLIPPTSLNSQEQTIQTVYMDNKNMIKKLEVFQNKVCLPHISHTSSTPIDYFDLVTSAKNDEEFLLLLIICDPNIHDIPRKNLINLPAGLNFINTGDVLINFDNQKIFLRFTLQDRADSASPIRHLVMEVRFNYTQSFIKGTKAVESPCLAQKNNANNHTGTSISPKAITLARQCSLTDLLEFSNLQFSLFDSTD
ncbi:MAG: hypothetical protein KBD64_08410 [Gammaproteobacteria bacterium]|nr:hypothetical protein [Gammaproteobacteria bacterium]